MKYVSISAVMVYLSFMRFGRVLVMLVNRKMVAQRKPNEKML